MSNQLNVTLRLYLPHDAMDEETERFLHNSEDILLFETSCYLNQQTGLSLDPYFRIALSSWQENRVREMYVYLVAYDKTEPVGFLRLELDGGVTHTYSNFLPQAAPHYLIIATCFVDRDYRRSGIATKMLKSAMDLAKSKGYRGVALDTAANNTNAMNLYRTLGFRVLETQWYGATNFNEDAYSDIRVLRPHEAVRHKTFRRLIDTQLYQDSQRWPILTSYRSALRGHIFKCITKMQLPVILFNNGRDGAAAISNTSDRLISGFPTIFTERAMRHPRALIRNLDQMASVGKKFYRSTTMHYSTLQKTDFSQYGLKKTYFVMIKDF